MISATSNTGQDFPLVSVIIPCYQQGRFLADAIESVLTQTHPNHEIIVVDDGSTDETGEVARRFPQAHYIRKANGGAGSARNAGLKVSRGDYLVFLDADDWLVPRALDIGLSAFAARPECALTFGSCQRVDQLGAPLPTFWRRLASDDYYLTFLRRAYIYNPASAMFRRFIFDAGVSFDEPTRLCSDYEMYLQVARRWPVCCHNEVVSKYRQHGAQQTANRRNMVQMIVKILESQEPFIRDKPKYKKMAAKGSRLVRHAYSHYLLTSAWKSLWAGQWTTPTKVFQNFSAMTRRSPGTSFRGQSSEPAGKNSTARKRVLRTRSSHRFPPSEVELPLVTLNRCRTSAGSRRRCWFC
jgi:glycosyltransferase involved in cell wall biosynthesis